MVEEDSNPLEIVLAEDNPADVKLVRMALHDAGLDCALRVIEDGEQVIAFIEAVDADPRVVLIDLLLLDMHLPRHDGEDILKRLRSTERCAQTPVIVMTASDAPQDHYKAQKHAAMHYFRKPAALDEFLQLGVIVRGILSRKKTADKEYVASSKRGAVA
jgi:DNA-binding response OmpR family regulator